jgi:AraC-like DNA-binding protein
MINFGSPHRLIDKSDERRYSLMRDSWIAGFQTGYLLNEPVAETFMLGVRFKPGGAFPFFDLPIDELSNLVVDMDWLWGRDIGQIRERLLSESTLEGRFRLMERFLLQRMRFDCHGLDAIQHAVEAISRRHGIVSIGDLSEHIGISQKHLSQQFKRMVGVSPKVLARIMKFQKLLHSVDPSQPVNWMDLAHHCHYYDQAHFNHDFAAFTGLTPSDYIRLPLKIATTAPNKDTAAYFASTYKSVLGIPVEVETVERATHIKAMNAGEVAFFHWGWSAGYPDALYFLSQVWYGPSVYNRSRWQNDEFDALIEKSQSVPDSAQRYALYLQAVQVLVDDWVTCPTSVRMQIASVRPNVEGVHLTPFRFLPFQAVKIDEAG